MVDPITVAKVGASLLGFLGGGQEAKAERRKQRLANQALDRILPVQKQEFDYRYNLSDVLNNLLIGNEVNRYNQVGGKEVALRGEIGDESIARFDEQASAVDRQMTRNNASVAELLDRIKAASDAGVSRSNEEVARQRGFQTTADNAMAALVPDLGAGADAARRGASVASRMVRANDAIGAAETGGYAPQTASRVVAEFARRGNEARDSAIDQAGADADVASYGDSRAAVDRTLNNFTTMMAQLRAQAETSRGALGAELALTDRQGRNAIGDFEGRDALSQITAAGERSIADNYRSGRMSAIESAGSGDLDSLSNLFARLGENYRTDYTGRMGASDRYENLFSGLMRDKAARIMGTPTPASPLTSIGNLIGGIAGAL